MCIRMQGAKVITITTYVQNIQFISGSIIKKNKNFWESGVAVDGGGGGGWHEGG